MILVANTSSKSVSDDICPSIASGPGIQLSGPKVSEASDIFMTPMLVENGNDFGKNERGAAAATLTAVQQAVVLAQCLLIKKGSSYDEMQGKGIKYLSTEPSASMSITFDFLCTYLSILSHDIVNLLLRCYYCSKEAFRKIKSLKYL